MDCVKHAGEKVFMVCKSCVEYPFVCGVCIEEDHGRHALLTLRNAAQSIRGKLENVEKDQLQDYALIKSDLTDFSKLRAEQKKKARLAEIGMKKQDDLLHEQINTTKQEVVQKHKPELDKNTEAMDRTEQALKQQVSQIDTFQGKVAQLQKMNDYVDVIMAGRDVEVPDTSYIPRPDMHAPVFTPGTISTGQLSQMFGGIQVADDHDNNGTIVVTCDNSAGAQEDNTNMSSDFVGSIKRESNIKVTLVNSFNLSKDDGIDTMFCYKPGVCWLKCQGKNSVKLSNRSGHVKQAINLGTRSDGCTVTSDNRLLFCCTAQKCIKEMELPNGEIVEKFSTSPLIPSHICTGPSGDIYVTLHDNDDYIVTKSSTRVLVRYTRYGREKARSRCGDRNIFVVPEKVCVNNSGTRVAVINRIQERYRVLVVLDQDLSPILIYTGPSVLTGDSFTGFELTGVMFDTRDNILVVEAHSQTVQLLSPSCEPLKVLLTMDTLPWAMTVHENEVWVGNYAGKVQIFRYSY